MSNETNLTKSADDYLEALARELAISDTRYEQAHRSYQSLGEWLHRPESTIREYDPQVYVQGSFKLGTAIRPVTDDEDYDVDAVCELALLSTNSMSQQDLKELVGKEVSAYRKAKGIVKPVKDGRRCWTLEYSDGAQFHIDILPAVPDGKRQRILVEKAGFSVDRSETAIAITDKERADYSYVSDDWPRSNPKGYADWFRSKMADQFEKQRRTLAEANKASVEDIPEYRVRTPLQSAIMILKRHRDMTFNGNKDDKPISIIISTLAARSYRSEPSIGMALLGILARMDSYIDRNPAGEAIIRNPSDPLENFADKWIEYPERERAFFDWLAAARKDFRRIAIQDDPALIERSASTAIGGNLAKRAAASGTASGATLLHSPSSAASTDNLSFSDQRREPTQPRGFA